MLKISLFNSSEGNIFWSWVPLSSNSKKNVQLFSLPRVIIIFLKTFSSFRTFTVSIHLNLSMVSSFLKKNSKLRCSSFLDILCSSKIVFLDGSLEVYFYRKILLISMISIAHGLRWHFSLLYGALEAVCHLFVFVCIRHFHMLAKGRHRKVGTLCLYGSCKLVPELD